MRLTVVDGDIASTVSTVVNVSSVKLIVVDASVTCDCVVVVASVGNGSDVELDVAPDDVLAVVGVGVVVAVVVVGIAVVTVVVVADENF